MGEGLGGEEGGGGGGGVLILDGFCSCPAGHGRFSGVGFWAFFGPGVHSGSVLVGFRAFVLGISACRLFSIKRIHGACGGQIMRPCPC